MAPAHGGSKSVDEVGGKGRVFLTKQRYLPLSWLGLPNYSQELSDVNRM